MLVNLIALLQPGTEHSPAMGYNPGLQVQAELLLLSYESELQRLQYVSFSQIAQLLIAVEHNIH